MHRLWVYGTAIVAYFASRLLFSGLGLGLLGVLYVVGTWATWGDIDRKGLDAPNYIVEDQIFNLNNHEVVQYKKQNPDLDFDDYRDPWRCIGRKHNYVCLYANPNPWATLRITYQEHWNYIHAMPAMMPIDDDGSDDPKKFEAGLIAAYQAEHADPHLEAGVPASCDGYRDVHVCYYEERSRWAAIKIAPYRYVHERPTVEMVERGEVAKYRDLLDDPSFLYVPPRYCTGEALWGNLHHTCFYDAANSYATLKAANGLYVHMIDPTSEVTLTSVPSKHAAVGLRGPLIVAGIILAIGLTLRFFGDKIIPEPTPTPRPIPRKRLAAPVKLLAPPTA